MQFILIAPGRDRGRGYSGVSGNMATAVCQVTEGAVARSASRPRQR
ncbi:MAG: hypothetical protein ACRYG8_40425 [Janthinobacterium lividum]